MPNPFSPYVLGGVVPVSTANVVPQVEHRVDIVQAPVNGDGWIAYNGFFLGYYPGSLFTQLNQGACYSGWYTEVLDQTSEHEWVKTQVGIGKFPSLAGPLDVVSVRQPKYWDLSWVLQDPSDGRMGPENRDCYDRSDLTDLGPLLGKQFRAGGPGGDNPACMKLP